MCYTKDKNQRKLAMPDNPPKGFKDNAHTRHKRHATPAPAHTTHHPSTPWPFAHRMRTSFYPQQYGFLVMSQPLAMANEGARSTSRAYASPSSNSAALKAAWRGPGHWRWQAQVLVAQAGQISHGLQGSRDFCIFFIGVVGQRHRRNSNGGWRMEHSPEGRRDQLHQSQPQT
jgi:hypothetical protein